MVDRYGALVYRAAREREKHAILLKFFLADETFIPAVTTKRIPKESFFPNDEFLCHPCLQENEFLERLESFSVDRGVTVPKQPMWRGKRISLFKFYNLVLKHGGFEKVS